MPNKEMVINTDIVDEALGRNVGIVYYVNQEMIDLYRIILHEGGSRSGKTYNTMEFLIDYALANPFVEITCASRDMPHLKKGCMKDFLQILIKRKLYRDSEWNKTEHKYEFRNGAYIEFFNADDLGKVSGPGRDILFCNEVNFFKKVVFDQLVLRTRKTIICDYNPIHPKHWLYDKVAIRKDCYIWKSTYQDNKDFLPEVQVKEIEMLRDTDPIAWNVYGLGLRGAYQKGQIYGSKPFKPWKEITTTEFLQIEVPEICGIDWGFYPDPNAVCGVKALEDGRRFIRKLVYENSQSDEALADYLHAIGKGEDDIFIADHQKKSILKMRELGFPLTYQAVKPPGSVENGIKLIRPMDVSYVGDPDMEFEYTNYTYLLGPDEEPTGKAQDKHNHLMDAFRMVELYREYL